jgi:hypothetical protein
VSWPVKNTAPAVHDWRLLLPGPLPVLIITEVFGHRISIQAFDGRGVIQITGVVLGDIGHTGAFRLPVSADAIAYLRENVPAFCYSARSLCDGFRQQ